MDLYIYYIKLKQLDSALEPNIANNQEMMYNSTNESESDVNGRESNRTETFEQNEQGRVEGLFSQYRRGKENDRGHQRNLTQQQEIDYIRDQNNHIKEKDLSTFQKNIKDRYEKAGIPVNFYALDSKNGGKYDNGIYINTYGLTELSVFLFIDLIVTVFIKVTKGINKRIIIEILSFFTILTIFFFRIVGLVLWASLFILDKTEHVVVIDSKKYVATVVDRFLDTDVEYYDYINFLLKGNKKKMSKTYKRFF